MMMNSSDYLQEQEKVGYHERFILYKSGVDCCFLIEYWFIICKLCSRDILVKII